MDGEERTDDYDSPWKDAITRYLPEFMAFYFPDADAEIDWNRSHRFLDQELAQVVRDAELGKRSVDRLVEVATHTSGTRWVYVHLEVQGQHDAGFAERLFVYNYRLFDRYRRPIATLAVLADERPHWKPERYGYELFGCRHYLEFPAVKLLDYQDRLEPLLADPNPFALVTAAHLLTRQTRHDPQGRYAAKWRLARLLYQRDWDRQRIIDLFAVIDWLLRLPQELEERLWGAVMELEKEKNMPYVTSVERIGLRRGLEQGRKEGLQEGSRIGRQEGEAIVLLRQIELKFGPPDAAVRKRVQSADAETLLRWSERILTAASLDELFA
ncbi:RpnC/YadD family protein [Thioalkalivibrio paradoxus]|uniref:Cytosolic protein n=1 Tax=Thioalkalivibrio paradoxus ARh 1 TaxID=713585 RepID=W0DIX2_9GAMM|nr:hypothetical protein [Thioalkalivibrio paradoxus]AHE96953.1 hypothetical protein THITH_00215 [Thioalkalivibrio paradoxus ARh 1]